MVSGKDVGQYKKKIVNEVIRLIPNISSHHNRQDEVYCFFDKIIRDYFSEFKGDYLDVSLLDGMYWPKIKIGNIDSYTFFSMDEILLYCFYEKNKSRYKRAFDIGSHLGIDAIIMSRLGLEVHAFEPEKSNYNRLCDNVSANNCNNFYSNNVALSDSRGVSKFVVVKGNTSANHLAGARDHYGEIETVDVNMMTFSDVGLEPDLMKINIEGSEKYLVPTIPASVWMRCDSFIEVHDEENQHVLFDFFKRIGINMFSQKIGWAVVSTVDQVPKNNKEGYLFVSDKSQMPW